MTGPPAVPDALGDLVLDGSTEFERDTAVEALGGGRFSGRISPRWWIVVGPNGGYVAAVVLRAVIAAVDDDGRRPLSATFHFLRPPTDGPVQIEVTIERVGRTVTTASARMTQDGRLLVLALVALGVPQQGGLTFDETGGLPDRPDGGPVAHWSRIEARSVDPERDIPMRSRYELRWGFGATPFAAQQGSTADCAGWLRLRESPPLDEVVLVAMADAWLPPVFSRVAEPLAVPTVDLTVHFRGRPSPALDPADRPWCFVRFSSPLADDGYIVEHGSVWDASGRLLAEVRQLAVAIPT